MRLAQWHGHDRPYLLGQAEPDGFRGGHPLGDLDRGLALSSAAMISSTTAGGADAPARQADRRYPGQPAELDVRRAVDQVRWRTGPLRGLHQPDRVGGVRRASHEHQVGLGGDSPHRRPAGWSWRSRCRRCRARASREPLAQRAGHLRGLVDRQRGLHQVGDLARVRRAQPGDVLRRSAPGPWSPAPRPGCPRPPRGPRGRSARPVYPSAANRRASACTLDTSGQVASITVASPRRAASVADRRATRRARRTPRWPRPAPGRARPRTPRRGRSSVGHHVGVVHDLLAHVDRLAPAARARARRSRWPARPRRRTTAARPAAPGAGLPAAAHRVGPRRGGPQRPQRAQPAARPPEPMPATGWTGVSETARITATGRSAGRGGQRRRLQVGEPACRRSASPRPLRTAATSWSTRRHPARPGRQPGPAQLARQQRRRRARGRWSTSDLGADHQVARGRGRRSARHRSPAIGRARRTYPAGAAPPASARPGP